jgi:hypothetical protein
MERMSADSSPSPPQHAFCMDRCAQVVRKVDELPLPAMAELMRTRKTERYFTVDTQALVDMSMFAKAIGKGLLDPAEPVPDEPPSPQATRRSSCSCGAVCWPTCPNNPVHGDPTDFLRARRMARVTWGVARVQAHWRGYATRKHRGVVMQLLASQNKEADSTAACVTQTPRKAAGGKTATQVERDDALAALQVRTHP